jgi:hypothetical protein
MAGPAYYSGVMNIAKNEDWVVAFAYGTPQTDGSILPIDLTGSVIKLEIRMNEADHEAIVAVTSENGDGIYITDAPGGQFTIAIGREDRLFRLGPGQYFADLVRLMPSGYQERVWEGNAIVVEGTTR